MTDQNIAGFLKQLRKTSGLSANEVSDRLKNFNIDISFRTLYGYESGLSMPNADVFVALCRIYRCDNPMELFGNSSITSKEYKHIEKYRSLDTFGQETVDYILNRELARTSQLENATSAPAAMRIYTYVNKIACAGNGFYFEDIPTDQIEAPEVPGTDFIIGVSGDSMEPTFQDGDKLYVQKAQIVETGEIGIFMINNECFVKEAGSDGLLSHNPKYDMIPGNENIICVGKVLGKVK